MNRVREASTMSVPTMRQMLGLKKTASYWLIKSNGSMFSRFTEKCA